MEKNRIHIGTAFAEKEHGMCVLCADVDGLTETKRLRYAVDEKQEALLSDCGECFVLGLLLKAMETGKDLYYEGALSSRFMHELNEYLIPSAAAARSMYHKIQVHAAAVDDRTVSPVLAEATAMQVSDEERFDAVVEREKSDAYYPLTHLCLFCEEVERSSPHIRHLKEKGQNYGLPLVYLEHNLGELYEHRTKDIICMLELSAAAALSGGLGRYLYRSEHALTSEDTGEKDEKNLDVVFCSFASAEPMNVYLFDRNEEDLC